MPKSFVRVPPRAKGASPRVKKPAASKVTGKTRKQKRASGFSAAPDWAMTSIFHHAKAIAWEGEASPLNAHLLYPENSSLLQSAGVNGTRPHAWADLVHPIDRKRTIQFFSGLTVAATPASIEYRIVDLSGSAVWVRHWVESMERRAGKTWIRGYVSDIQAEKEYQLESLRVSEREQNRIGQDLHDDLCQVLAGVSCLMRVFEGRVAAKAPEEVENLKELNQQIIDAMHRTRALTHGLFPGKIQIADIRGALLELASQVKARFKVGINTQFAGRFPKHSSAQIIQIYRISQEAMSNAIKHGRATEIEVKLEAQPHAMELSIIDNGSGFPKGENAGSGVGMSIMKYRANMLGGDVLVMENSKRGVAVKLRYPFEAN